MKMKWMLWGELVLASALSQAAPVYNGTTYYNATDYTATTALSNDKSSEYQYLYINTVGEVSTSNPAGNDVWLLAFRNRDSNTGDRNIEEYVKVDGSATDGFHLSYRSLGSTVDDRIGFGGGNLLYKIDDSTPGDTYTTTTGYLGFRISAGTVGSYYYGWAKVSGFIKTENALLYDLNQAQVKIEELAIMDTPDVFIEVGSVIPEPAGAGLIAVVAGLALFIRRRFCE
ncbi:MAG: hypothetical protein AB7E95_02925 [Kiritimatiellales bacterium]